jgi:radical SAM superfamily enzyme YgiQ (UPF0313 family)
MFPAIGPIGLDYIAGAAKKAGIAVDVVDLCLADDPAETLKSYFSCPPGTSRSPQLVGLSFRNVDDCFWPSAKWFVPELADTVRLIKSMTDAPVVIGGVGFSIFAKRIVEFTGADFGIHGDGEQAIVSLINELQQSKHFERVSGLVWRDKGSLRTNLPAWPKPLSLPVDRDAIDNLTYLKRGGQCGLETKRGCNRPCIYCADPLAKGPKVRLRDPAEVADEVQSLLAQGIDMLHLCDSEFNIPRKHAYAVCGEFIRRGLGERLRWYTYMAVSPFDAELAQAMRKAGCVGIDFTGDSACPQMLKTYRQQHCKEDLASAVRLCRDNGIRVMIDLLLGGPGETPKTLSETIEFIRQIDPDCAGAPLGIRIYPGTAISELVASQGPAETNSNIRRNYTGEVDFFKPTFYISESLGEHPARLVQDLIAGDKRFFGPIPEPNTASKSGPATDHNYNDNAVLAAAIEKGEKGAYWDILRRSR